MTDTFVRTSIENGVMNITIDRQEKLNALNIEVVAQLQAAIDVAASQNDVRCVIITGAGNKAFVAGADIAEIRKLDKEQMRTITALGSGLMSSIENLGKPVIAAINGYALGGGCELALACHIRIASDTANLGFPEIQLGLMPGYGGTQRLSRLIGQGRSLEMILTGKPINADQAVSCGLVNQVVEAGELSNASGKLAASLARSAPIAMKSILEAVISGSDNNLAQGLELEADLFVALCETNDMREGTAAFLEKRKPEFKGS